MCLHEFIFKVLNRSNSFSTKMNETGCVQCSSPWLIPEGKVTVKVGSHDCCSCSCFNDTLGRDAAMLLLQSSDQSALWSNRGAGCRGQKATVMGCIRNHLTEAQWLIKIAWPVSQMSYWRRSMVSLHITTQHMPVRSQLWLVILY